MKNNEDAALRDDILEGRNPVIEALKSGRQIDKILISKGENKGSVSKIIAMAKEKKILVSFAERAKLDQISQTGAHQGVIAYTAAASYVSVKDILNYAKEQNEDPLIIICDCLNDAHNLGSIIRTAELLRSARRYNSETQKRRTVGSMRKSRRRSNRIYENLQSNKPCPDD